jgi:hypothetical protein
LVIPKFEGGRMSRVLRWVLGIGLAAALIGGAILVLPFSSWLPGGTVAEISTREVVNGTEFNALFPRAAAGDTLVFTQEKRGFSEAKLKHDGEVTALLAISDTITAPEARTKFETAQTRLKGWPLVDQGAQASALLVADRFQVKVIGQGTGLEPQRRHELLGAFDLQSLAALQPAATRGRLAKTAQPPPLPPASGDRLPQPELQTSVPQPAS